VPTLAKPRCDESRSFPRLVEASSHVPPDNNGIPILPYKSTGLSAGNVPDALSGLCFMFGPLEAENWLA
jgi:hypothetical protein